MGSVITLKPEHIRLPIWKAALYSLILTISYVGVLYVKRSTRPSSDIKRDDPAVVKSRITAISIVSLFAVFLFVPFVLVWEGVYENWYLAWSTLRIFWGWKIPSPSVLGFLETFLILILDCLKALTLTGVLFIGPLADILYFSYQELSYNLGYGPGHANLKSLSRDIKASLSTIYGFRNFVTGPITEEFVFRACVIALFLASPSSATTLIFVTPLFFGVAHVHHAYELFTEDNEYPPHVIFLTTLFQFIFTTIFGWYAAFLFLRLGSVWPCIAVHVLCNSLGPPSFGPIGKSNVQTWIYRGLLVIGLIGFSQLMFPLTESSNQIL